jgi:hypothetical protein
MIDCPECEHPFDPGQLRECPKCGCHFRSCFALGLLEEDVAHAGESWHQAREKIIRAFDTALNRGHSGVKIIHGYGASAGRSVIRNQALPLLRSFAERYGGRLTQDKHNPGAHIVWFRSKP